MNRLARVVLALTLTATLPASARTVSTEEPVRLVTVGHGITETVFALGLGDDVVGADEGSQHPPDVRARANLGYMRALSAEGILSLDPTAVLVSAEAGPPSTLRQLRAAGVAVHVIDAGHTVEAACARVEQVAAAVGREKQGQILSERIRADCARAGDEVAARAGRPRVMFLYARSPAALYVSGAATPADAMLRLAGGVNAIEGFEGYEALTSEAVVAAAPEVILMPAKSLAVAGGVDAVSRHPALRLTPAGRHKRIVAMDDDKLLSFGPRLGEAISELAEGFRRVQPSAPDAPQR